MVKRNKTKFWSLWAMLCLAVFIIFVVGYDIAMTYEAAVNSFLDISTTKITGLGELTASDYAFTKEDENRLAQDNRRVYQQIVEEGTTLVKNENGALPLQSGSKVSIFGIASAAYLDLKADLENNGVDVNDTLYQAYASFNASNYQPVSSTDAREVPWADVQASLGTDFDGTALVVLGRRASEGTDAIPGRSNNNMEAAYVAADDYLALSQNEADLLRGLKGLKDSGRFDSIVVVITTSNSINSAYIDDPQYGVDALVWTSGDIGQAEAATGIANLLTNKDGLDFSGRLVDTMYVNNQLLPEMQNFGYVTADLSAVDAEVEREVKEAQGQWRGAQGNYWNTTVTYAEGIYHSYRYYETRYEDYVLNANAHGAYANWSYDSYVAEPFGKGLHYNTDIEYTSFAVSQATETSDFEVTVGVTNNGDAPVKHSILLYMQTPYSEYDIENGIEEASIKLVGYDKIELPADGQEHTVTITVSVEQMRSYDEFRAKTYIRDGGEYYITVGEDVHDAMNNILSVKANEDQKARMDAEGDASLVWHRGYSFDDEIFATSDTGFSITNQFAHADLNQDAYAQAAGNDITYLSRTNWVTTFPTTVKVKYNDDMVRQAAPQTYVMDESLNETIEERQFGVDHGLTVIDVMNEDFDSAIWDQFMEQLTIDEIVDNVTYGQDVGRPIPRLGVPGTKDSNGPSGYGGSTAYGDERTISFTGGDLRAATFNDELLEEMGRQTAENMYHYPGDRLINLWGWGMNIHRTPYGGRNSQYYSEDAFISGMVSAAETRGLQEKGAYAMTKHFVLNDQETNRHGIATWANETTIREVYLPGWEIAAKEGGLTSVMSSFNRLGMVWVGQDYNAQVNVLRGEFGMQGSFITDMYEADYMDGVDGVIGGTTKWLASASAYVVDPIYEQIEKGDRLFIERLVEAAKRNLWQVTHSFAMDGYTENTVVEVITPWWQVVILAVIVVSAVGTVGCIAMAVRAHVLKKRRIARRRQDTFA